MIGAIVRIIIGPTLADRILGLDTITILAVGIIGVFAVRTGLALYADIAIAVALVGFLSTVAFARYLLSRGRQ
jgi:multicomponent Na+:H+ antiporter subunit F